MINLIPIEKKRVMLQFFYMRFATVLLFTLGFAFLAGAVAILPAYFASSVKLSIAEDDLSKEKADVLSLEDVTALGKLAELENKFNLISSINETKYVVSEKVIDSVLLRKTNQIKIRDISYETKPTGEKMVTVRGEASSRESLLEFKVALERDPNWQKVDLPVSNFIRGSNISFTFTLTSS